MSTSYEAEWVARFGEEGRFTGDLPDLPWLRQILLRRTHRRYAERPVAEPLLRLLLGAAFAASSKSDFQQASAIWVKNRNQRERLAALVPDMPWVGSAPVFLVFCGDAHRLERIGRLRDHCQDNGRLEGFFNAAIDAALVMQTFILAAETAGLGCCPISVIRNHADAVAEILRLPEKVFPVAGVCAGYPALPGHISMRLPSQVTVHTDQYDDKHLAQAVDAYDHRRDARYSLPREQQRSPDIFGYASFYGWSEDKARQATRPEGQCFPCHLRARGFTLD
ncbi:MAG: nitroreductase family protein [Alphaproteobacteria bacterium]|nr:nitroreductase family protein [Alphaproteobacteria bacterium]